MRESLRRRGPTAIAVTLAFLAGGGAAVTAQNLITSADIKDGTIQAADLANGAVNSNKIANQSVANADLANNAVGSAKISDGAVATADIANGAVNSNKILNGAVATADLANQAVNSDKIADGSVTSKDILNGTIQTADISAGAQDALTAVSGSNWGVMDRNVIGNGDTDLRAGPSFVQVGDPPDVTVELTPAPAGVGSLGIRTGAGTDKAAFGNALDFLGDPVSDLTNVSFFVFTTGENISESPINLPNISIEILANLGPVPGDYTTMVYEPPQQAPGWQEHDAAADAVAHWRVTGAEGDTTGCNQVTACTFTELMTALNDGGDPALIGTVGISKGSDFAFSGAVDALQINDTIYDFEPNGVFATPAAP